MFIGSPLNSAGGDWLALHYPGTMEGPLLYPSLSWQAPDDFRDRWAPNSFFLENTKAGCGRRYSQKRKNRFEKPFFSFGKVF